MRDRTEKDRLHKNPKKKSNGNSPEVRPTFRIRTVSVRGPRQGCTTSRRIRWSQQVRIAGSRVCRSRKFGTVIRVRRFGKTGAVDSVRRSRHVCILSRACGQLQICVTGRDRRFGQACRNLGGGNCCWDVGGFVGGGGRGVRWFCISWSQQLLRIP